MVIDGRLAHSSPNPITNTGHRFIRQRNRSPGAHWALNVAAFPTVTDRRVAAAGGQLEQLAERIRTRDRHMTGLPPVDASPDGVLTSLFNDGILLFNRDAKAVARRRTA
jgi:hypothetical protein